MSFCYNLNLKFLSIKPFIKNQPFKHKMMRKIYLLLILIISLVSCENNISENIENTPIDTIIEEEVVIEEEEVVEEEVIEEDRQYLEEITF